LAHLWTRAGKRVKSFARILSFIVLMLIVSPPCLFDPDSLWGYLNCKG
jgi:hypothetical protein